MLKLRRRFERVRHQCWNMIEREYPEEKTKYDISLDLVREVIKGVNSNSLLYILDAGCGHHSGIDFRSIPEIYFVGTDLVFNDVKANKTISSGLVSNLNSLPFKNNSIDILFCNMVLEHLTEPEIFFREATRVLHKNGYLIFSTPCIYNIVTIINRLLPDIVSRKLSSLLTQADEDDVFPAVYKANSVRRIRKLLKDNNFSEEIIIMYQPPPYAFVFSKIICKLMILYYRLINNYDSLKFARGVIIGKFKKL